LSCCIIAPLFSPPRDNFLSSLGLPQHRQPQPPHQIMASNPLLLGPPITLTPPSVTDLPLPEAGPSRLHAFPSWSPSPTAALPYRPPRIRGQSLEISSNRTVDSSHQRVSSQPYDPRQRRSSLPSSPVIGANHALKLHDRLDKAILEEKLATMKDPEKKQEPSTEEKPVGGDLGGRTALLDLPPPLSCYLRVDSLGVGVPDRAKATS